MIELVFDVPDNISEGRTLRPAFFFACAAESLYAVRGFRQESAARRIKRPATFSIIEVTPDWGYWDADIRM